MLFRLVFKKHIRILFLTLGSILWSLPIAAQGIKVFDERNEVIELPFELSMQLSNSIDKYEVILKSWSASNGFFNASVSRINERDFQIEKGCRFSINEVYSKGVEELTFQSLTGESYSDKLVEDYIKVVLIDFERQGYLFSKIEVESIEPVLKHCKVDLYLNTDKGDILYSNSILFPGARVNNSDYLRNISGFQDSVLINSVYLNELQSNLFQSELFTEVAYPEIYFEDGNAVIVIAVEERSLNQFDGLLGYVPDQNGNGQIVGDFELSLWNVLNQGNGFDLQYQRLRPETTRLNVGISQNWFGSIPLGLGFNFNLYQNDTTYQTRNIKLNADYQISSGLKLTGGIGQITSVSSNSVPLIREPDGKKRYGELGFIYSTLDNFDVPTKGISLSVGFGITGKNIETDSSLTFNQRYVDSEASYFIPVGSKSVITIGFQAFLLDTEKVTENDLIRFGGANSFRGYEEEQFSASMLVWGDVEYRFLVNRSSYLFAFTSAGRYHRKKLVTEADNTFQVSDNLYSTGFGISYKIRIGRLKFTYAISPEESLGNGKIHVGIITKL